MMKLSIFLVFAMAFLLSQQQGCERISAGDEIADCYSINIWNEQLPPVEDPDCSSSDDSLLYVTEEITVNQGDSVGMTFAAAVLGINSTDPTKVDECTNLLKDVYNLTVYFGWNYKPNETHHLAEKIIENIPPLDFPDLDDLKAIKDIDVQSLGVADVLKIANQFKSKTELFTSWEIPVGTGRYYVRFVYNHPYDARDCYLEVALYSCWVDSYMTKILIGVGVGIAVAALCVLLSVTAVLVVCCLCCKGRKSRRIF